MLKYLSILVLLLFTSIYSQWVQVNNGLGSLKIKSLGLLNNNLVAVTADQGIFISSDNGNNWSPHPQNNTLPNFNLFYAYSDFILGQGMIVLGQGFLSYLSGNSIINVPIVGIPNNKLTSYTSEEGGGIPESHILGTDGSGVFYADNLSSTNWTEIPGLNNTNSKIITGLNILNDGDDEYLLVATRNGMYISAKNSLSSLSEFNKGISGNALNVNNMFGNFIMTKSGVYFIPEDNALTTGWLTLYPTGDFRTAIIDYLGENFYFFGDNIGIRFDGTNTFVENLTGVTSGIITSGLMLYTGFKMLNRYLFLGTEQGGIFRKQITTDLVDDKNIPNDFNLEQNYPNPFNPTTKISWSVPFSAHQTLKIYDVLGNEIITLVDEYRTAGKYEIEFDAKDLSSGVYFYKLQVNNSSEKTGQSFIKTKKMILTK